MTFCTCCRLPGLHNCGSRSQGRPSPQGAYSQRIRAAPACRAWPWPGHSLLLLLPHGRQQVRRSRRRIPPQAWALGTCCKRLCSHSCGFRTGHSSSHLAENWAKRTQARGSPSARSQRHRTLQGPRVHRRESSPFGGSSATCSRRQPQESIPASPLCTGCTRSAWRSCDCRSWGTASPQISRPHQWVAASGWSTCCKPTCSRSCDCGMSRKSSLPPSAPAWALSSRPFQG